MAREKLVCSVLLCFLVASEATKLHDWIEDRQSETGPKHNTRRPARQTADKHTKTAKTSHTHAITDHTSQKTQNIESVNLDCLPTQQKFVEDNIGDASLTISSPINDPDMSLCYAGGTGRVSCCTRTMERAYQRRAEAQYHTTLASTTAYLTHLMADNSQHYQELFLTLLNGAHNKTERLFSEVYHLPLMERWGPTESLFLDLKAYLQGRNVSLQQSVDAFFDELFPLVFHNNVNDPRTSELDEDYRECLMQVRRDIYPPPFGGASGKLAHELSRALGSARVFLEALRLGVRVINATTHLEVSPACSAALTRLQYCGHCDTHTSVAPCRGFCYNVMRGCYAHITDINIHWNEFIDGLELLTVNMRGAFDIEEVLHGLHTKVSEAIMHAMETGYKYSPKVVKRCGQPKMRRSPVAGEADHKGPLSRASARSALLPAPLELNARLYAKIEMFMRNVIAAKGFFSHVPDTMCSEESFSAGLQQRCWNGDSVAPYNNSILTKDLSAQLQNPEVSVSRRAPHGVTALTDLLATFRKVLSSRVSLEQMQGDAQQPQVNYNYNQDPGRGGQWGGHSSGDWQVGYYQGGYYNQGGPMDDEDWYSSGSGGYGSGGYPNIRTSITKRPGHGHQPDHNNDITFDGGDGTNTAPPYFTRKPGDTGEQYNPSSAHHTAPLTAALLIACWAATHYLV